MPPAARITDLTICPIHGGGPLVLVGAPTVLIGGLPAARLGDACVCPVGGPNPIIQGSGTVLIGGMPAARLGDSMAHPGSMVVLGCPTVIIGG